jgi:hypothetical protein
MSAEKWADVPGWEGLYEVSDLGRVRSASRPFTYGNGTTITRPGRVLTGRKMLRGHLRVALCDGDRREDYLVHRLVLIAFVGPCPDGMEGCHNNGVPSDNRLENLRWDTRKANMADAIEHGVHISVVRRQKTTCKWGHPLSGDNLYQINERRHCRTCKRDSERRRAA